MSNIINMTLFNIKNKRKMIMFWSIGVFSMMFMYMILFTSMKELGTAKLEAMPKPMLEMFGIENMNLMNDWIQYFIMIFGIFVLIVSFFSATFSAGVINDEEKNKSIEFLYGLKVSRKEIYLSKLLSSFIAIMILCIMMFISAILCGFINGGKTFILIDFITVFKGASLTIFIFWSFGTMIAGLSGKIAAKSISSGAVFITYMFGFLGGLLEDKGKFLTYISPFRIFDGNAILEMRDDTIIAFVIYVILMLFMIIIGLQAYKNRDFAL